MTNYAHPPQIAVCSQCQQERPCIRYRREPWCRDCLCPDPTPEERQAEFDDAIYSESMLASAVAFAQHRSTRRNKE
jgi:hypothetical protein